MINLATHLAPPARPRRGLILPLVLIVLAVAIILGMCFLTSASTATQLSTAVDHRLRARMIAESGLAMAVEYAESNQNWRSDRTNGVWVTSQGLDGGTFTVFGEDGDRVDATGAVVGDGNLLDDATDPLTLTCIGVYQDVRYLVRAVRRTPNAAGISVNERVEIKKTALVDSYNAEAGPYAPATAKAKAMAKSNGIAKKVYLLLRNNSRVNGDVYYGAGGTYAKSVQKDASATVTGTITNLPAAIVTPDITEPVWPVDGTGVDRSHSSGITTLSSDLWCDKFELKSSATLRVLGDVKLYVCGDFTVTDSAQIQIGTSANYAAATTGTITISDVSRVDCYDSTLGPYGGTNIGTGPMLATNRTASGSISIAGTTVGDAYSGVGSNPKSAISTSGGGTLTGQKKALGVALTIPAPPTPPALTAMPDINLSGGVSSILTDMKVGKLVASGGATIVVTGNRVVHVTDEFKIDDSTLNIPAGSSLTVYAANKITFTGNAAKVNAATKNPSKLLIYATGSGFTHEINNYAEAYAIIDAPNSTLSMDDHGNFFGAFMGSSLMMKNSSQLHLDRNPAVAAANARLPMGYTSGNKLTVYVANKTMFDKNARLNQNTADPLNLAIYHLGPVPMEVKDNAIAFAEAFVPEMTLNISGAARWTGRLRPRDLTIGGTAIVTVDGSGGTADPGVLVEETLELKENCVINGLGGTALLASHGATDMTIQLKDTAVYKGDGYTGPGGSPTDEIRVAATATYTGTKNALVLPIPIAALPTPPVVGSPSDRTIGGSTVAVISGDVYYKKLEVKDNAVLEIDRDTRIILTDNFKVLKNARVVLRPGARLTVYCLKEVQIAENAQVNVGGHPGRVTLSCPITPKIEMHNTARICATLLAPLAEFKLNDTNEFFGAFSGRRLKLEGGSKFHCAQTQRGSVSWIEQQ